MTPSHLSPLVCRKQNVTNKKQSQRNQPRNPICARPIERVHFSSSKNARIHVEKYQFVILLYPNVGEKYVCGRRTMNCVPWQIGLGHKLKAKLMVFCFGGTILSETIILSVRSKKLQSFLCYKNMVCSQYLGLQMLRSKFSSVSAVLPQQSNLLDI